MRKDILFTTWHFDQVELYQKMASLIDAKVIPIQTPSVLQYYWHILTSEWENVKWVIHLDEDNFVFDSDRLYNLIAYMERKGYDVAGIPDGGVSTIRRNNPLSINPFLAIFNYEKIKPLLIKNPEFSYKCDDLVKYAPKFLFKEGVKYDLNGKSEQYYPLFFKLLREGCKFLYLDGVESELDILSTYLFDHENEPFLIHTWFSRRYQEWLGEGSWPKHSHEAGEIEYNTYRINDIFELHKTKELGRKSYLEQLK